MIDADTKKNYMISITIDFKSNSVQEEEDFDEVEYILRYRKNV